MKKGESFCDSSRFQMEESYQEEEHILVYMSSSHGTAKLLEAAAEMANVFHGKLTAFFVENAAFQKCSPEENQRLKKNMRLAKQMGARVETSYGKDATLQIITYAKASGVTRVVMGKGGERYILDRMLEEQPNLNIYIIPNIKTYKSVPFQKSFSDFSIKKSAVWLKWRDIGKTVLIFLVATLLGLFFYKIGLEESNIILLYMLAVLFVSVSTNGRGYSIFTSVISVLAFNFLFTDPRYTLRAYDKGYPITFLVMLIIAFLTSSLALQIKHQAVKSAQAAHRMRVLLETSQLLQEKKDDDEIFDAVAHQLIKLLHKNIVTYSVKDEILRNPLIHWINSGDGECGEYAKQEERLVAEWVFHHKKCAGVGMDVFEGAKYVYFAVQGANAAYGVIGIEMEGKELSTEENSLILSILGECGLALEKEQFRAKREEAFARAQNETLRANLLRAISHDLRTPLTSISGNAGVLLSNRASLSEDMCHRLYKNIYDDSMWLISLVENLLAVTRIENGTMKLHMEAELLEEVLTEALQHINPKKNEHHIQVIQKDDLLIGKMDARLIVQVIINLVDNAIKYTEKGSHITLTAGKEKGWIFVEVADDGGGISDEDKAHIFEMFYTANNQIADSRRSMGLGLSLCKTIINAHGGELTVRDNDPNGSIFHFTLEAEEVKYHD